MNVVNIPLFIGFQLILLVGFRNHPQYQDFQSCKHIGHLLEGQRCRTGMAIYMGFKWIS